MFRDFERWYLNSEEYYWWFKGRRNLLCRIIKNFNRNFLKILDIGCSGGILMEELEKNKIGIVFGIDNSKYAIQKCRKRGLKNVRLGDACKLPYKNDFFDIVIASDLLEHIESESKALEEWKRVLKIGGYLILGVPAFDFLYGYHDYIQKHKRRYIKQNLENLIKGKLMVIKLSYWNFFLFVPITFMKIFTRNRRINYDKIIIPKLINSLLTALLKIENILITKYNIYFPFGISIIVVFKKLK